MCGKREGLIHRRKELGLSQRDVARKLGISQGTYWDIENGRYGISIDNCLKISKVFKRNAFVLLNRIDKDLNIYDKDEQLKLIWIFVKNGGEVIDMLRVEDSHGKWKDLTLDEFSNILYFRVTQGFSLNVTYQAQESEKSNFLYVHDKSESFQFWCENQGEFGQNIIENVQLPYGITLEDNQGLF